jgi:hypothetical protein
MPKFETQSREMAERSREERVRLMESLNVQCLCPKCPTHTECAKRSREKLFCFHGKSFICIDAEVECLCPGCPVHDEMGLKHDFFCTRGSEKAQRYEQEVWNIQH